VAQTFLSATGEILFSTTNVYDGIDLVAEMSPGTSKPATYGQIKTSQ